MDLEFEGPEGGPGVSTDSDAFPLQSLILLTGTYPCQVGPTWQIFVRRVAHSLARQGVRVRIITPLAYHRAWRGRDPLRVTEDAGRGQEIEVWRPRYLSLSAYRVGRWTSYALTYRGFVRAVEKVLRKLQPGLTEAFYGHFLYPAGAAATSMGLKWGLPSFPAVGEGQLNTIRFLGKARARRDLAEATGFISNSGELARLLQIDLGIAPGKIGVFPNGVDESHFFPRNQAECRARFGLPADRFLVGCVARFDPDKGAQRVAQAIDGLPGVGGVFAGWGTPVPTASNICLLKRVQHEEIPYLLSACDVFALPTLYEGCCNAILEAIACGLPVISSTGAFNDEILAPGYSIRLDPYDVDGLRAAVRELQSAPQRCQLMAQDARRAARKFGIDVRARAVISFMQTMVSEHRRIRGSKPREDCVKKISAKS